jgi:hypothetical protein
MSRHEDLGDGVYARDTGTSICLTGNAHDRENVIYLDRETYEALRRFAQRCGYEPASTEHPA